MLKRQFCCKSGVDVEATVLLQIRGRVNIQRRVLGKGTSGPSDGFSPFRRSRLQEPVDVLLRKKPADAQACGVWLYCTHTSTRKFAAGLIARNAVPFSASSFPVSTTLARARVAFALVCSGRLVLRARCAFVRCSPSTTAQMWETCP